MISRVTPLSRDRAAVLGVGVAETITLIDGSSFSAIVGDVAAGEVAGAAVQRRGAGLEPALVDHEDCIVSTPLRPAWHGAVGGIGLVVEGEPGDAGRRDDRRAWLGGTSPMKPTVNLRPLSPRNRLMPYAGKSGLAGRVHDDVRGQVLEVGARVALGRRLAVGLARTARRCSRRRRGSRRSGCAAARARPCRTRGCRPRRSRRASGWRRSSTAPVEEAVRRAGWRRCCHRRAPSPAAVAVLRLLVLDRPWPGRRRRRRTGRRCSAPPARGCRGSR